MPFIAQERTKTQSYQNMEIQEVKNAYAAYGKFSEIEPYEFVLIHPFTDDHVIIRTKLEYQLYQIKE